MAQPVNRTLFVGFYISRASIRRDDLDLLAFRRQKVGELAGSLPVFFLSVSDSFQIGFRFLDGFTFF